MKIYLLLISLFILSVTSAFSQTMEEQLLKKREQKIMNYRIQAKSGNRNIKSSVLDKILEEFETENYSKKDEELLELISFLSEEGTIRQEYENNLLVNNFPEVRRKACLVLSKLGGDIARRALINVLTNDPNTTVKAEACNALARVKDNSSGEVLRTIVYVYRSNWRPDPNFVFAIINAVKRIAKGNASSYADAIMVLSEIQMGKYSKMVREEAYAAIQYLQGS